MSKLLFSLDTESEELELHAAQGWRLPSGDELTLLQRAMSCPLPLWLDLGVAGAGFCALAVIVFFAFGPQP